MPNFSEKSRNKLNTLDIKLQKILLSAIDIIDFSIQEGYRSQEEQLRFFEEGKSQLKFGKHNVYPSEAADIYPYPYNGGDSRDIKQLYFLIGIIKGIASQQGIKIRLGLDWNGNLETRDENFIDAFHVELCK